MPAADAAGPPIVGRRSPEIRRLVRTMKAKLAGASPFRSTYGRGRSADADVRAGGSAWNIDWNAADLHIDIVVVNALAEEGSIDPGTVTELVRTARAQQPCRIVIVVLDEESQEAVRAARDAGASEFLGRDEIENPEAVFWRLRNAALLSRAVPAFEEGAPADPIKRRPFTVRKSGRPKAAARDSAAAIEAALAALPTAEERRARGRNLLEVVAPELRDPGSGRLDARRIAEATGLSLAALARASGISQQALSATPDSPGAQPGLLPIARVAVLLDEIFSLEHKRVWLQTPNARFGGRTPAQAIEERDADLVALSVESALEGHPD